MNKYSWDLNYLIKKRDELQRKVDIYESSLATYDALIASFDKRIKGCNCGYKDDIDGISTDMNIKDFVDEILPHTNPYALEMLLQTKDIFLQYKWMTEELKYSPCYLNNKQLVDYTVSLINQIPHENFVKSIKSCVMSKRNLLHIKHANKLSTNYEGLSFVDFSQKRPYGLIARQNNVNGIITLAHELFHMVIKKDQDPSSITYANYIYDEIEGYLANFIARDFLLEEKYPQKEMNLSDAQDLLKTEWTVYDAFITTSLVNFADETYKVPLGTANNYLKQEGIKFKITKNNINGFFYSSFNEELHYAFSYLAALDLYKLYKSDPEKAINHLYTIKNFKGENIEKELESIDVTFTQDGYQNLQEKCNQLLKKKTTKK